MNNFKNLIDSFPKQNRFQLGQFSLNQLINLKIHFIEQFSKPASLDVIIRFLEQTNNTEGLKVWLMIAITCLGKKKVNNWFAQEIQL
jgi:hypothetical protein